METIKLTLAFLVLTTVAAAATAVDDSYYTQKTHVPRREKITKLHFFFHDILGGKNPTAVLVAKSNTTTNDTAASATPFGTVFVIDDPLTVGPNLSSGVIGNVQGMYVSSGQDVLSLVAYFDFAFTSGKFNGSSISVFSRNPVMETERELAVVGGRGQFRMARGFAQLKTYSIDPKNGDAIVEYNVTIIH